MTIPKIKSYPVLIHHLCIRVLALTACTTFFVGSLSAQQTAGGTQIQNQAQATYSDGTGNNYSSVSNTVTVQVANVSSISITPDGGTRTPITPGQQGARFTFRLTNTGNFADQMRFLANGQSIQVTGPGTVSAAAIDLNSNGTIDAGDTDIFTNGADVISASIASNGFIDVIVGINVNNNAAAGSTINVQLGDSITGGPSFDNQPANSSAHEVRTVSASSVNGLREGRGDLTATVNNDAQLRLNLTAPAGPVALGSNINYVWETCNTGLQPAQSIVLSNAPGGANSVVFIVAPIPVGTALGSGQSFPAGTLYSITPLSVSPLTATYTTASPLDVTTVRRVAFNVGATLANNTCSSQFQMAVTVTSSNAALNIFEIGDTFANNSGGTQITDQSGDTVSGAGDGNANFDEGNQPGNVDGNGIQLVTTLQQAGAGLIGPLNNPAATGPNSQNDDYTNRSVRNGISGLSFGSVTSAPDTIIFSNTIRNTGNTNDTYIISAPSVPANFVVEVSRDGTTYTQISPSGNTLSVPVTIGTDATILVRVTAPAGLQVLENNGYPVVIRATSSVTSGSFNETIDRVYTGFIRVDKTATVVNNTGVGNATDPVSGAEIEYVINYRNISSTGGSNNGELTANNVVINEEGNVAPNNWGMTTTQVVSSASDTRGGTITGDTAGSVKLTDTINTLAPQQAGTFRFKRRIN